MKNLRGFYLISLLVVLALPAAAADRISGSPQQIAQCMRARMKADQRESYRDALQACKDQKQAVAAAGGSVTALNASPGSSQTKP